MLYVNFLIAGTSLLQNKAAEFTILVKHRYGVEKKSEMILQLIFFHFFTKMVCFNERNDHMTQYKLYTFISILVSEIISHFLETWLIQTSAGGIISLSKAPKNLLKVKKLILFENISSGKLMRYWTNRRISAQYDYCCVFTSINGDFIP